MGQEAFGAGEAFLRASLSPTIPANASKRPGARVGARFWAIADRRGHHVAEDLEVVGSAK